MVSEDFVYHNTCNYINPHGCDQFWLKHILLARTVDIIKQMLTVLKLQGLEWKQHAYVIPFLASFDPWSLIGNIYEGDY